MPTGNETNHEIVGLTVRGGLGMGQNGPYLAENEQYNPWFGGRYGVLETFPRALATATTLAITNQRIQIWFWDAPVTKTITTMEFTSGGTAAGATPTTVRYGIYTLSDPKAVGAALTLTLAASTVNDTALFAAQNTRYPKALSAPYTLNAGQRYGLAVLVDSGATIPTLAGFQANSVNAGLVASVAPQQGTHNSSQTDLVTTMTCANATALSAYIAMF